MVDSSLKIICEDLSTHPACPHGPTILFAKKDTVTGKSREFYACSACRSRDECSFFMYKENFHPKTFQQKLVVSSDLDPIAARLLRTKILKQPLFKDRSYCHTCSTLIKTSESVTHHRLHLIKKGLTDDELQYPCNLLQPISNVKTQAQYFFSEQTMEFFKSLLEHLNIKKVICIGAPKLHEFIRNKCQHIALKSILLDIDFRFHYFYQNDEFVWYNMFNHHFLGGQMEKEVFHKFLNNEEGEGPPLLFTDPPFGCRTEPLVQTIKEVSSKYQSINKTTLILPVFWIFPYYMEVYIKKFSPEMEMSDYKINYANHKQYSDGKNARKHGSPVRLFTNIPLNLIILPESEGYTFCKECDRWKMKENVHCFKCGKCPSKNGETYRHCTTCAQCVKPKYEHCYPCSRCTQRFGHNCIEYQKNLNCWICRQKGHGENSCKLLEKLRGKQKSLLRRISRQKKNRLRLCKICLQPSEHNELKCGSRKKILSEEIFLGEFLPPVFT